MSPSETFVQKFKQFEERLVKLFGETEADITFMPLVRTDGSAMGAALRRLERGYAWSRMRLLTFYDKEGNTEAFDRIMKESLEHFTKYENLGSLWDELVRLCGSEAAVSRWAAELRAAQVAAANS